MTVPHVPYPHMPDYDESEDAHIAHLEDRITNLESVVESARQWFEADTQMWDVLGISRDLDIKSDNARRQAAAKVHRAKAHFQKALEGTKP